MSTPDSADHATRSPAKAGGFWLLLRPFESVWLGITLLTVLLVYSSIGSALPFVRESRFFELSEFEWFNWWPFAVLAALLCVNLTVVTVRKIPFNTIKLGVWMIHTGIVLMTLSSWWYFANKIEGDAPVFRRMVTATVPGGETATFPALPGASGSAGGYTFTVANLDPTWPILSGEHEGEEAFSVSVMVTDESGEREPFIRQLLAGYPQYTEDIIPGLGRAVKSTGEKLIDAELSMGLAHAPQEWFHLAQTHAFYVREVGTQEWTELPVSGLPRYNDYADDPGRELWLAPGDPVPPAGGIDVEIGGFDDATGVGARATGYVRYAMLQERVIAANAEGSPAVTVTLVGPQGGQQVVQLAEGVSGYETGVNGAIALAVVRSDEELEALLASSLPALRVRVGEEGEELRINETVVDDPDLAFREVGESGFSYRVRLAADRLRMPGSEDVSAAIVEIKTPEDELFVRFVSADGMLIQDINTEENGGTERETFEERIEIGYEPGGAPAAITLVIGPDLSSDVSILEASTGAAPSVTPVVVGTPLPLITGGRLVVHEVFPSAVIDERPSIIPRNQRSLSAGAYYSLVQVEVGGEQVWMPYHEYVVDGPGYAYQGKFRYEPTVIEGSNGRRFEVLFSRERMAFPAPVVLEEFHLEAHVGGFTGATPTIRDWISDVRFETEDGWTDIHEVKTNHPGSYAGLSYFQARWDPPTEMGGGFAFTGLGVGSRSGVSAMLASSCLSVAGMIYVFYVKPSIQRRRVMRALEAKASAVPEREESVPARVEEPVEVGV